MENACERCGAPAGANRFCGKGCASRAQWASQEGRRRMLEGLARRPTGLPRYRCIRCGRVASYPPSMRMKTGVRHRFCSPSCYRAALPLVKRMRFWAKAAIAAGCWEWMAARDGDGYGVHSGDSWWGYAHRRAWELTNGPVPAGLWVLHRCDNRACVRPSHLWLGDNAANSLDRDEKGRWRGGAVPGSFGHRLTEPELAAYAQHYLAHVLPPRMVAAALGLTVRQAAAVVRYVIANR